RRHVRGTRERKQFDRPGGEFQHRWHGNRNDSRARDRRGGEYTGSGWDVNRLGEERCKYDGSAGESERIEQQEEGPEETNALVKKTQRSNEVAELRTLKTTPAPVTPRVRIRRQVLLLVGHPYRSAASLRRRRRNRLCGALSTSNHQAGPGPLVQVSD